VKTGEDADDNEESASIEDNYEGVGGGRLMMMMIESGLLQVMAKDVGNAVDKGGWCTCAIPVQGTEGYGGNVVPRATKNCTMLKNRLHLG
jgi:hypothetical protein